MVPVEQCRFTLQAISVPHLFEVPDLPRDEGPILVSRMDNGEFFVHNGRHRVIRARLAGDRWIDATSLYENDGTAPVAEPL